MKTGKGVREIAYPAVFGAAALAVLYLGAVLPVGAWGMAAVAGLFPVAVVASVGFAAGLLCWAGVTILAFLLLPDKFLALLFGALFGLYAVVKGLIERLRRPVPEYLLKLLFFNASLAVIYFTMRTTMLSSLPAAFNSAAWAIAPVGSVVFLAYDYGLSKLIAFYMNRVYRYIRRGERGGSH